MAASAGRVTRWWAASAFVSDAAQSILPRASGGGGMPSMTGAWPLRNMVMDCQIAQFRLWRFASKLRGNERMRAALALALIVPALSACQSAEEKRAAETGEIEVANAKTEQVAKLIKAAAPRTA